MPTQKCQYVVIILRRMRKPTNLGIPECNQNIEQMHVIAINTRMSARTKVKWCMVKKKTLGANECLGIAEYLCHCWREGGGDSLMKGARMLVVSLRDVKLFLVSPWMFSEQKCYATLMRPNKSEKAVHGCHWLGDVVVCLIQQFSPSALGINFSENNSCSY